MIGPNELLSLLLYAVVGVSVDVSQRSLRSVAGYWRTTTLLHRWTSFSRWFSLNLTSVWKSRCHCTFSEAFNNSYSILLLRYSHCLRFSHCLRYSHCLRVSSAFIVHHLVFASRFGLVVFYYAFPKLLVGRLSGFRVLFQRGFLLITE